MSFHRKESVSELLKKRVAVTIKEVNGQYTVVPVESQDVVLTSCNNLSEAKEFCRLAVLPVLESLDE